jgi:hypothetical protein
MDVDTQSMREDIISRNAEINSTIGAIEEKMEAAIHCIQSEVEIVQHRMENVTTGYPTEGLDNEMIKTQ